MNDTINEISTRSALVLHEWTSKSTRKRFPWIDISRGRGQVSADERDLGRMSFIAWELVTDLGLVIDLSSIDPDAVPRMLSRVSPRAFRGPVVFIGPPIDVDGFVRAATTQEAARLLLGRDLAGVKGDAPPKLQEVALATSVTATTRFGVDSKGARRGFLRLLGQYPPGSRGRATAAFISAVLNCDLLDGGPKSVIIDLSEFKYEWGDDLAIYPRGFDSRDAQIRFVANAELVRAAGIGPEHVSQSIGNAEQELNALDDQKSAIIALEFGRLLERFAKGQYTKGEATAVAIRSLGSSEDLIDRWQALPQWVRNDIVETLEEVTYNRDLFLAGPDGPEFLRGISLLRRRLQGVLSEKQLASTSSGVVSEK